MAEGGGRPWSRHRNRRRQNDREGRENEEIDRDLLRVVLSDSEDFVPEDVKSTSSVACSCASDFQEEQTGCNSSNVKSCPNLSDLDPEVRSRTFRWFARQVSRRKSAKESAKRPSDKNRRSDRDENGLSYYARCLQEAKRVRRAAELEAIKRRTRPQQARRRRPLSLLSFRAGNDEPGVQDARRKRFSFSWGFRQDDSTTQADEGRDRANTVPSRPLSPTPPSDDSPTDDRRTNTMSFEEFHRKRKEKARLKAAQHKLEYFLISDIVSITNCPWYWGKINRFEAEKILEGFPDGTFLLRDSAQYHYLFSVSFRRYSRTYHARIEQWKHKYSFDKPSDYSYCSTSVCHLLQHYSRAEQCMYYEPLLLKPLHRTNPVSLQDLCRATICSQTTFQGVGNLPVPNSIMIFLREFHYKVPVKRTEEKGTQTPAPRKRFSFSFHRD